MITNDFKKNAKTAYTLRIDTQIFEQIRETASENRRSIAKEIEYAVAQYLQKETK